MAKEKKYRVILSGGGTGGHIYPAIAIANEIKNRYPKTTFLFVGANSRMEMEKVPKAGYAIKGLWIAGLQRKLSLNNLLFPIKLLQSLWKARNILKEFKPDIAIGTGGYASGPLLQMASMQKIPCLIQEQNSFPGITNKLLGKKVQKICVAYDNLEHYFPKEKIYKTGNPVRQDILHINTKRNDAIAHFNLNETKKTLLVLGGSLGARNINMLLEKELNYLNTKDLQVIWQCGSFYFNEYKIYNAEKHVQVHAFLNQMDFAYAAADFIISRAGAISVSELCIVGKPVIFIPSPNVAEDHQTKNARAIVNKKAAILLKEEDAEKEFETIFNTLINKQSLQEELGTNIKKLALPNATNEIVNEIEKLLEK